MFDSEWVSELVQVPPAESATPTTISCALLEQVTAESFPSVTGSQAALIGLSLALDEAQRWMMSALDQKSPVMQATHGRMAEFWLRMARRYVPNVSEPAAPSEGAAR